ncbi:MAG: LysM peptidoglycan-binding domain-containing protein [Bacteroidales bacterium]|nr:LysM peptidoglycan-binding domain-containing protein [Clostridium sp.]MCM1203310.1 LysM peptidoglycan-binding domain-containing protein [Bacteroidales bacterium]
MGDVVAKASLIVEGKTEEIQVDFNPSEYNLVNSIHYAEQSVSGLDGPIGQYIAGNSTTLKVTFIFDTYTPPTLENPQEGGSDVTEQTKKIAKLTLIDGTLHRVPQVTFSWGSIKFTGVITEVVENYTLFLADGKPVQAKLDVTFKSVYDISTGKKSSPFESPDRTKVKTVLAGEALWSIAAQEYGDSEAWKVIARENGILNPLDIFPGQRLKLPPL